MFFLLLTGLIDLFFYDELHESFYRDLKQKPTAIFLSPFYLFLKCLILKTTGSIFAMSFTLLIDLFFLYKIC